MAAKHRAKHQMDKPRVKPRCCCRSYWWIIWSFLSFSFFSPSFFLVLLNFFLFLFPAMWSQRNQAWCLHPVLTPVITHSRFSILIVAHPVFWACSSIRNSRNKGCPSRLLEFPLSLQEFQVAQGRGHPGGCRTPKTQRRRWAMEKQSEKSQGEKRHWIHDYDRFKRHFIGPGLRYWHSWKLCSALNCCCL